MEHTIRTKQIIAFAVPMIISGILQLIFNVCDMIIVGQVVGKDALAAVGSTTSLVGFSLHFFIGVSTGVTVITANAVGQKNEKKKYQVIVNGLILGFVMGFVFSICGITFSPNLLYVTGCPENVLNQADLYMRIIFSGLIGEVLFNFGAGVLRGTGNTKTPMNILVITGVLNLVLNLLFTILFHWGVAGVAIATVISKYASAAMILGGFILSNKNELIKCKVDLSLMKEIGRIGLPAGVQGALFAISNVFIQSAINSFGSDAVAGCAASASIEGFTYQFINAYAQAAVSLTGQQVGAGHMKEVPNILRKCVVCSTLFVLITAVFLLVFHKTVLGFYSGETAIMNYGLIRMSIVVSTHFLGGFLDITVGSIRGMGNSFMPMIVSLLGACGLRIIWIMTAFHVWHSLVVLFLIYPISWALTWVVQMIIYKKTYQRVLQSVR